MFLRLWTIFIIIPCVELVLLATLGRAIGLLPTICIIILTGALGAGLARAQGIVAIGNIQRAVAAGRMPATEIVDGFLIFAAGLLLITPGFLTDTVGFSLLIPAVRSLLRRRAVDFVKANMKVHTTFGGQAHRNDAPGNSASHSGHATDVIDVEAESLDREG